MNLASSLFLVACLSASLSSFAAPSWLEGSNAAIRAATKQEAPEWLKPRQAKAVELEAAQEISDRGGDAVRNQIGAPKQDPQHEGKKYLTPLILVSTAIPRGNMKGIIEEAVETGSTLVFRGVPKGQNVLYLNKYIQSFGGKVIPSVVLDPTLFTRLKTVQVPTVAYPIGSGSKFAVVRGLVNIDWMTRKLRSKDLTQDIDLGSFGTTWAAVEPDLIEEMKRRAASIDWDKKKQAAIDRFWSKQSYTDLPESRENRVFEFDPTIVLDQDISSAHGVAIKAGTSINPLARMTMSKRYIFFDASKPAQVDTAVRLHKEAVRSGRSTSLIATRVNVEQGWNGFSELNGRFEQDVTLLNPLIRDRFHLQYVPAYADAVNLQMRITEVVPDRGARK